MRNGSITLGRKPWNRLFRRINMPTRIFEFLTRGKPVIGPCTPGVREYFPEDSLVFFELGDVADLALKIEYVIRNALKVVEITRRGQEVCMAHPWCRGRETLVQMTLKLLPGNRVSQRVNEGYAEARAE